MKRSKAFSIAKNIYKDLSKRNGFNHIVDIDNNIKREILNAWTCIIQEEVIEL